MLNEQKIPREKLKSKTKVEFLEDPILLQRQLKIILKEGTSANFFWTFRRKEALLWAIQTSRITVEQAFRLGFSAHELCELIKRKRLFGTRGLLISNKRRLNYDHVYCKRTKGKSNPSPEKNPSGLPRNVRQSGRHEKKTARK